MNERHTINLGRLAWQVAGRTLEVTVFLEEATIHLEVVVVVVEAIRFKASFRPAQEVLLEVGKAFEQKVSPLGKMETSTCPI